MRMAMRKRKGETPAPAGGAAVPAQPESISRPPARLDSSVRAIAMYLPQFHPIPENNQWWGKGFTEWTNVAKARPLFPGHYQPHLPANLGFYDLRVPEVREKQAALAKQHNIEAFCYWHYWFGGRRLLERPFNEVLASGRPDHSFCLAWANETWSRRWLGEEKDVLCAQIYSAEDDLRHIQWLLGAFADPRYLRVDGRPVFLVYKPNDLPEPRRTVERFRTVSQRAGMPDPYLVGVNAHRRTVDCRGIGFDATMDFEPQLAVLSNPFAEGLKVSDYAVARRRMVSTREPYEIHPCICVGWDNTPRRGQNGIVFVNSSPDQFEAGLMEVVESVLHKPYDHRLVFINAWNEWAEGNHLEPDMKHGLGYLEAVKRVTTPRPA